VNYVPSFGARLLASSNASDFTLLQMGVDVPAGRAHLGWISSPTMAGLGGQKWYRLSHPYHWSLYYEEGSVVSNPQGGCDALPQGPFTYSAPEIGGAAGGSSGSAMYVNLGSGPQVIGQLYGKCGPAPENDCLPSNYTVDGSFYNTYQTIRAWLNPPKPPEIRSVTPPSGPVGTKVFLSGLRFTGTRAVSFDGALAQFRILSDNQVVAIVPSNATSGYVGLATDAGSGYAPTGFSVANTAWSIPFGSAGDIPVTGDFDGDHRADFGVFRPSNGTWYLDLRHDGWKPGSDLAIPFGMSGDVPLVADFNGDGLADPCVFRPSTGWYFVDLARNGGANGQYLAAPFGRSGDVPFAADFDGDRRAEFGVFRPSTSRYYVDFGRNGWRSTEDLSVGFGLAEDLPFVGDFDADGFDDFGVFRPSTGWYYVDLGRNGGANGRYIAVPFGRAGDRPYVGDFDGDGREEIALFRPSTGWHYSDVGHDGWDPFVDTARPFGQNGDVPFVGRFESDRRSRYGVFRPSTGWYYVSLD
jgi:hypothetical protein